MLAEASIWDWLLGQDSQRTGTPEFQWGYMPESWGVFVLIAIVIGALAFVIWLYLREINTAPPAVKIFLAGLRCLVVLMVILLCLKPEIVFKKSRVLKASIPFARDISPSIDRRDQYSDEALVASISKATGFSVEDLKQGSYSRADILQQVMRNPELLRQLREKGSIRIFDFSDKVKPPATIPALGSGENDAAGSNVADGNDAGKNSAGKNSAGKNSVANTDVSNRWFGR